MRVRRTGIGVLSVVFAACGGSDGPAHVEISGKTPTEAAAIAAQAVCGREARCGHVVITCSGSGSAGGSGSDAAPTMTCSASIAPVSRDDCFADASGDIADLLTCAAPSAEQIDILETCFDTMAARPCVTQTEADALARASEMGSSPPPDEPPPACALLADPPPACGAPTRALRGR